MKWIWILFFVLMSVGLLGVMYLNLNPIAGRKTVSVMSSVCTPKMPSDLDHGFISSVLMSAGLPEGATVESEMILGSPASSKTVIKYRGRSHMVNVRPDGIGACFDFVPPIQD